MAAQVPLSLSALDEPLADCRLDPRAWIPEWATSCAFFSVTRTPDELSIVCHERAVPPGVACEPGWRALKLEGPFDFTLVGVLVAAAAPLADAGVSILAIATYDTDYVLVKEAELDRAASALRERGHRVMV
jgi:hypothetical protein